MYAFRQACYHSELTGLDGSGWFITAFTTNMEVVDSHTVRRQNHVNRI